MKKYAWYIAGGLAIWYFAMRKKPGTVDVNMNNPAYGWGGLGAASSAPRLQEFGNMPGNTGVVGPNYG